MVLKTVLFGRLAAVQQLFGAGEWISWAAAQTRFKGLRRITVLGSRLADASRSMGQSSPKPSARPEKRNSAPDCNWPFAPV